LVNLSIVGIVDMKLFSSDAVQSRIIQNYLHEKRIEQQQPTVQSACCRRRLSERRELYGCTTTSLTSSEFGKTEKVVTIFFGK